MIYQIPSIKFNRRLAAESCRQFPAYEVGLLNDYSKDYAITWTAWSREEKRNGTAS